MDVVFFGGMGIGNCEGGQYLDENDVRAGFGEGDRHVCANAAGAACDDGSPAFKGEEGGEGGRHCWGLEAEIG